MSVIADALLPSRSRAICTECALLCYDAKGNSVILLQCAAERLRERVRQAEAARDEAQARARVLQQRLELAEAGGVPQRSGLGYVRQAAAARDEAELRARVLQQRLDLAEEAAAARPGMPGLSAGLGAQQHVKLSPRLSPAAAARPSFDDRACALAGTPSAMDAGKSAEDPLSNMPVASTGPATARAFEVALRSMPGGSAARPAPLGRSAPRLARQGGGGNPLRSPTLGSLEVLVAGTEAMVAQSLAADAGLAPGRRTPRREGAYLAANPRAGEPLPGSPGRHPDIENAGSLRPVLQDAAELPGRSETAYAVGGAGNLPAAAARSRRLHVQGAEAAAHIRQAAPGLETPKNPADGQAAAARSPLAEVSPQRQVPLAAGAGPLPPAKAAPPRGRHDVPKLSPKPKTPSPGLAARMRAGLFGGSRSRSATAGPGAAGAGGGAGPRGGACSGAAAEVDASLCLHGSPMSPPVAEKVGGLPEAAATSKGEVFVSFTHWQRSALQVANKAS